MKSKVNYGTKNYKSLSNTSCPVIEVAGEALLMEIEAATLIRAFTEGVHVKIFDG